MNNSILSPSNAIIEGFFIPENPFTHSGLDHGSTPHQSNFVAFNRKESV